MFTKHRQRPSSRHLLPGSSVTQSPEQAAGWIPVTSTGMTVGAWVLAVEH